METTVKERITAYLAYRRISKSEFGRMIGASNAYVASIKASISPEKLQAISLCFPDLNIEWLMTGDGEMLKGTNQSVGDHTSGVVINGNNHLQNSPIDNRQYYSDSPDVLRATIDLLDERIKEKDAQIKEKDAQIKEKDAQIKQLLDILQQKR